VNYNKVTFKAKEITMEETFNFESLLDKLRDNVTGPLLEVRFFFLVLPFNFSSWQFLLQKFSSNSSLISYVEYDGICYSTVTLWLRHRKDNCTLIYELR